MAECLLAEKDQEGQRGFILIGAIWLLILCGAIAAILTLRSINAATMAAGEGEGLRTMLAQDAALDTVVADLLLAGARSRWASLPAEGEVEVGGLRMKVRVTNDLGRIDVNEADPKLVESVLRSFGLPAPERNIIVQRLLARRAAKRPIGSTLELRALLFVGSGASGPCLVDDFTPFSGLAEPPAAQLSPKLAAALGRAPGFTVPASAGDPLRIEITAPAGASLTAWLRLSGLFGRPYSISGFERRPVCG